MAIPGLSAALALGGMNAAEGLVNTMVGINQARINRQFQLDMSNTAYQRAMADMRAAGLNPMLAFSQGGASVGSGAVAKGEFGGMAEAVNTGLRFDVERKRADAEIEVAAAEAAKKRAETLTEVQRPALLEKQIDSEAKRPGLLGAETRATEARGKMTESEIPRVELEAKVWRALLPVMDDVIRAVRSIPRSDGVGGLVDKVESKLQGAAKAKWQEITSGWSKSMKESYGPVIRAFEWVFGRSDEAGSNSAVDYMRSQSESRHAWDRRR